MNLGKLLGTGKTFFGGNGIVAYRENKRVYLPKFNADRNPFTPKPAAPTPAAAPVAAAAREISVSAAPKPARVTSWKEKLNPFRAPEPVAPPLAGAVQVELSLEAVRPMGNDLAEADVEIIPLRSHTVAAPEAPMLPPPRQAWEFLGERIVKQA